ncbi:alpha/beta hydrolase [uncultured Bradyrhizobium sp.]|uniref:alpha/beta hydrolase n=1 Tax=uncultured Bradyrhizobium sp. TaxID=199684 RepID=UPI0035C9E094
MTAEIDYEAEYNNRARVPDHPALIAGWARDAQAYRASRPNLFDTISYGPGARNTIDVFPSRSEGAIVVFIHGGYWQALDGSFFSHLAAGLNTHGISVAIPSYDLCPQVSVDDIIAQMRMAARALARLGRCLVVSGHSAGGHLAACLMATDWRSIDAALPEDIVKAAYTISGLFDLGPLVRTSVNAALGLDRAGAKRASPLFWPVPSGGSLDAVVGADESAEYFRQSRTIADTWRRGGIETRFAEVPGANHFTAIAPLADPRSPMTLRLLELALHR